MNLDDAVRQAEERRRAASARANQAVAARHSEVAQAAEAARNRNEPDYERLCAASAEFAKRARGVSPPEVFPRGGIERRAVRKKMRVWRLESQVEYSSTKGGPDRRPGIYVATDGKVYLWEPFGRMEPATVITADTRLVDKCIRLMGEFLVDPRGAR